jgi:hypothetical protein
LDEELNKPPDELTTVIELLSFLAVVFGGIVLLNVFSSIRYKNGKFEYDAERGRKATKDWRCPRLKFLDEAYLQKTGFKLLPVLINAPDFGIHNKNQLLLRILVKLMKAKQKMMYST